MFTRGYAKHPCTQHVYSQGFAVGRVERYRRKERLLRGDPLYSRFFFEVAPRRNTTLNTI